MDSEKYLEDRLRDQVELKGGKTFKWVSPGFNGVPDRIVLMPGGRIWFIELKSTGAKSKNEKLQQWVAGILRKLGFIVLRIDNKIDLDEFLNTL